VEQAALETPTREINLDIQARVPQVKASLVVILGTEMVVDFMVAEAVVAQVHLVVVQCRLINWAAKAVSELCQPLLAQVCTMQVVAVAAHIIQQPLL
jgi:hypothetical protein